MGQVPSLVFNGHSMVESNSILRFIADWLKLTSLYPTDVKQRHAIDVMLDFCNTEFRPWLADANVGVFLGPVLRGMKKKTKTQWLELEAKAKDMIKKFQNSLTHKFAAGETFTIADIPLFYNLTMHVILFNVNLVDEFPRVAEWHKNCRNDNEIFKKNYEEYSQLLTGLWEKFGNIEDAPEEPVKVEVAPPA